ncbi:MAG: SRPBCC family protein [Devosia sp.]
MPRPLTMTTPGDRQIVVVREFDAPRDLVFLCYSRPDLLRRWYGLPDWTMPVCEMDFRVGGKWRFVSLAPDGKFEMGSQGVYNAIVPPERIEQTEYYDDDWTKGGTTNIVVFTEAAGVTTATMTITYTSPEARDGAAASPMAVGMEIGFKRLDATLAELNTN